MIATLALAAGPGGWDHLGDRGTAGSDSLDLVASALGTWHAMGAGTGGCECAVTSFVRGLTTVGTDAYIATDANDVGGIAQADHVARWTGTEWQAVGAGTGGGNGWFPTTVSIEDLTATGSNLFVTGTFQNADGDQRADNVAFFDGTAWHPLGSNGAADGPWVGAGHALAIVDRQLNAAGSFTSVGATTKRGRSPRSSSRRSSTRRWRR